MIERLVGWFLYHGIGYDSHLPGLSLYCSALGGRSRRRETRRVWNLFHSKHVGIESKPSILDPSVLNPCSKA